MLIACFKTMQYSWGDRSADEIEFACAPRVYDEANEIENFASNDYAPTWKCFWKKELV